ncbi:MAG TPA: hypothetical protein VH415_11015 [Nitrososphaeraceae archaeon]
MTQELTTSSFCEVCGINVCSNTNLKKFRNPFFSKGHMDYFVKSGQKRLAYKGSDKKSESQGTKEKGMGSVICLEAAG